MWKYNNIDELYHYGVLGMRWGKRKTGPSKMIGAKRTLARDKKDLSEINKGYKLSFGLTKKRQEAYDQRDINRLNKRIEKNEAKLDKKGNSGKIRVSDSIARIGGLTLSNLVSKKPIK